MRRIHVIAAVIRDAQGRILIAKRPDHVHQGGLWEFPGGKLEAGEPRFEGLARELLEELGIQVTEARPLLDIRHDYSDKSVRLDVWLVTGFDGDAHGAEGQPVRWVAAAELNNYAFPAANTPIVLAAQLPEQYLITPNVSDESELFAGLERAREAGVRLVQLRQTGLSGEAYRGLTERVLARFGDAFQWLAKGNEAPEWEGVGWHLTSEQLREMWLRAHATADPIDSRIRGNDGGWGSLSPVDSRVRGNDDGGSSSSPVDSRVRGNDDGGGSSSQVDSRVRGNDEGGSSLSSVDSRVRGDDEGWGSLSSVDSRVRGDDGGWGSSASVDSRVRGNDEGGSSSSPVDSHVRGNDGGRGSLSPVGSRVRGNDDGGSSSSSAKAGDPCSSPPLASNLSHKKTPPQIAPHHSPSQPYLAASCHNAEELAMAVAIGVDFVTLSPVQPTASHPDAPPLGWERTRELIDSVNIPVYLLGGMSADDLAQAFEAGAQGIAGIRGLWE